MKWGLSSKTDSYICQVFKLKAYLALVLILAGTAAASAQQRVWNEALDWYGYVCSKCAGWKDRIDRGQSVPKDSLQLMMRELTAVRQNLQGAWGEMSPKQRIRFEVIRDRFANGCWPGEALSPICTDVRLKPVASAPALAPLYLKRPETEAVKPRMESPPVSIPTCRWEPSPE